MNNERLVCILMGTQDTSVQYYTCGNNNNIQCRNRLTSLKKKKKNVCQ